MRTTTPRATKLLGAGGLLLTGVLGWVLVVGPQVSALAAVRLEIEDTSAQNEVLDTQLASLQQQSLSLGETRHTALELAAKFPPTADLPELFRIVTAAAVDAGIGPRGVTTLAPTAPVMSGTDPVTGLPLAEAGESKLARQTVLVSVTGTYAQTRQLLDNLEQLTRAYLITSITLTVGENAGIFQTAITGDMFVMPPPASPDEPIDDSNPTGS